MTVTLDGIRKNARPLYPAGPITTCWLWGQGGRDLRDPASRAAIAATWRETFRVYQETGAGKKMMGYVCAAESIEASDWPRVGLLMRLEEEQRWQRVLEMVEADRQQHERLLAIASDLEAGRRSL